MCRRRGTPDEREGFASGGDLNADDEGERPVFRAIEGWARYVLLEAGAVRECDEHGWIRDRGDPNAREREIHHARENPLFAQPLRHCGNSV